MPAPDEDELRAHGRGWSHSNLLPDVTWERNVDRLGAKSCALALGAVARDAVSPGRLLKFNMSLNWTPDLSDPELFHITHVDNLASIIACGGLFCDGKVAGGTVKPTTIGSPSIKARRLTWKMNLPDNPCVGDFVPFYFCPRSVMLYLICQGHPGWRGGQVEVLHLVTRVSTAQKLGKRLAFTDRNAATAYHRASEDLAELSTVVDFGIMPLEDWRNAKEARQAEFLVGEFVPWIAIERVVAMSASVATKVSSVVKNATPVPLVQVDPSWYY